MAVNVATLTARLEADIRDFDRDMKTARRRLDDIEKGAGKANRGMGLLKSGMLLAVSAVALRKMKQFGQEVIGLAVDAEEAASAFKTTFGSAVGRASKFVDEFAHKAGFAEFELQQLMATTGNVIQGLGATEEVSELLSEQMATLAGDVASFSNAAGGAPAVLKALQSALTGEREALKTYGIVVSETDVVERALLTTHKESAGELTKLDRAMATLAIATERAGKAVGDLDRTQDSSANTMRRINAMVVEMKKNIGEELMPAVEMFLPILEELILSLGPKLVDSVQTSLKYLLAIGGIFNEDMRHAANLVGVTQQLNEEWLDGASGVDKFYNGMRELDRVGSLTEGNFKAIAKSLGLTNKETHFAAEAMRDYLTQMGIPTDRIDEWIRSLNYELNAQTTGAFHAGDAMRRHGRALQEAKDQTKDLVPITDEMVGALGDIGDSARTAGRAFRDDLVAEMSGFLSFFEKAPAQAKITLKEMETTWIDNQKIMERYWGAIRKLAEGGFDDLVKEARDWGPEYVGQIEKIAASAEESAKFEGMIENARDAMFGTGDAITEALGIEKAAWVAAFFEAGEAMGVALQAALLGGNRLAALSAAGLTLRQAVQYGLIPKETTLNPTGPEGAGGGYMTKNPFATKPAAIPEGYASGGIVPGPIGKPQLAVVHGGEEVTPVGGGGSVVINQYITDDFRDPAAARRIIRELARELDEYGRETRR